MREPRHITGYVDWHGIATWSQGERQGERGRTFWWDNIQGAVIALSLVEEELARKVKLFLDVLNEIPGHCHIATSAH